MKRRNIIRSTVRSAVAVAMPIAIAAVVKSTEYFSRVNEKIDEGIGRSSHV